MAERNYRLINCDNGPNFCGSGDLALLSWLATGTRGTGDEVVLRSANKIELLRLLGQPHTEDYLLRPIGLSPHQIWHEEKKCKGSVPRYQQAMKLLGIKSQPKRPTLPVTPEAVEFAKEFWGSMDEKVLFCPESKDRSRQWPHWSGLQEMIAGVSLTQKACNNRWENAIEIIRMADVVVAVDSAYAHLAVTLAKPTVIILGTTKRTAFTHAEDCAVCIEPPSDSCAGCYYNAPFHELKCGNVGCKEIARISPIQVFEETKKVPKPLMFRSYAQLAQDVRRWIETDCECDKESSAELPRDQVL